MGLHESLIFILILKSHLHHSFYSCFCFHILFPHPEVSNFLNFSLAHNQAEEEHCKGQANGSSIQDLTMETSMDACHDDMIDMDITDITLPCGCSTQWNPQSKNSDPQGSIICNIFFILPSDFILQFYTLSKFQESGKKTWTKSDGSTTSMLKPAFQSLPSMELTLTYPIQGKVINFKSVNLLA